MKIEILKHLLLLVATGGLMTGCAAYSTYDLNHADLRAASMSSGFPPAPPTELNAPELQASGATYY